MFHKDQYKLPTSLSVVLLLDGNPTPVCFIAHLGKRDVPAAGSILGGRRRVESGSSSGQADKERRRAAG